MRNPGIIVVVLALFAMALNGCVKENQKKLKKIVDETNLACPIKENWGVIESLEYNTSDNVVTIKSTVSWLPFGQHEFPSDSIIKKTFILNQIANPDNKALFEELLTADASLELIYEVLALGREVTLKFTKEDVNEMVHSKKTEMKAQEELMEIQLALVSSQIKKSGGREEGPGMRIEELVYDGENVEYRIAIDEEMIDLGMMEKDKDAYKEALLKSKEKQSLYLTLAYLGKNLKYNHIGNKSGKNVEVVITPEDVMDLGMPEQNMSRENQPADSKK